MSSEPRRRWSRDFYFILALVLAAGIAAIIYLLNMNRAPEDGLFIPREAVMTPELLLLREYVRVDTTNPPGNELAGARFLGNIFDDRKVPYEIIESAPGRGNLYARIKGRKQGTALMLLHHIDVYPSDPAEWSKPPFVAGVKMNMMYGRGTLDMKGIGICELAAFLDVAKAGRQPEHDIIFLATADEETGGKEGVLWLLANRPDIFEGVRYVINEGGITETLGEKVTYFGVEVGSKLAGKLRVHSTNRRDLERARIYLEELIGGRDPERILPQIRDYFKAVSAHRIQGKELLADVDDAVRRGRFFRLHPTYRVLTQNNVVPSGIVEANGRYEMSVSIQSLPDEDQSGVISQLTERLSAFRVTVDVLDQQAKTPITSWSTPFFELLGKEARRQYGQIAVGPVVLPYSTTDSRHLRRRGIDCYGIWPFPVNLYQTRGIHGPDERVRLDWFDQGVQLTRRVVSAYAFGQS